MEKCTAFKKLALTIQESIEFTGLGRNTVYELVNTGKIGFVKACGSKGTKKVIPVTEWERYFSENLEYAETASKRR